MNFVRILYYTLHFVLKFLKQSFEKVGAKIKLVYYPLSD